MAWATPVLPTSDVRSSASAAADAPIDLLTAATARAGGPVTITWSSSSAARLADLSATATASSASGTYACSPKRSSHCLE